ncbi:MAG: tRNA pseudouridine(13) synthase TruD [Candidatus Thorarchaeota archaeon]|nr:tRNA pseudouridine(13) synthase TruD [Candidatus Thorarchaeota archaeon]
MIEPPQIEKSMGMELYSTSFTGFGGHLKQRYEDFIVEEILSKDKILQADIGLEEPFIHEDPLISGESRKSRFIHLTMQKMGMTTMDAAELISSSLRISRHLVSYAGLKDKRALTVQRISIPKSSFDALKELPLRRVWIRDPEYSRKQIQIGDLWGNRFTLLVRDLDIPCEQARELSKELRTDPILNYFGIQRFGVSRPFTHLIGKALTKQDYEEAARYILTKTTPDDSADIKELRESMRDGKFTEALLEKFPNDLRYERLMIKSLLNQPGDYKRAFFRIPPKMQKLFVHSYQSFLFNRIISLRAKEGLHLSEPEVGDFIVKLGKTNTHRDDWLFVSEKNHEEYCNLVQAGEFGLVATIPGYASKMPNTRQSEHVRRILKEENTTLDSFRFSESKEIDSPGGFHSVSIALSDLETKCVEGNLQIKFSLRKGSYATVVLRELMKSSPFDRL